MAAKDKTSKTARVMSLLSKKPDPAAPAEESAPAPAAPVPPIVTSMAPDAAVSVQIKNALEDALEGELPVQQPAPPQAEPVQEAAPAPQAEPEPASEPVRDSAPAPQPEPAPEPLAEQPAPASDEIQAPHEFLEPENPGYINVMQVLVEEKALKYVQMFGLCECDQCMADVKALALNHLPPKYVVMRQGDVIPKLTFYEGKYGSDIIAQLLNACRIVKEHPHHHR